MEAAKRGDHVWLLHKDEAEDSACSKEFSPRP